MLSSISRRTLRSTFHKNKFIDVSHRSSFISLQKNLFFSGMFTDKRTNDVLTNSEMSGGQLLAYIRSTVMLNPRQGLRAIERGWESGKLPFDDVYLKEYFKAAAALKKLDSVDITGLLALLKVSPNISDSAALSQNISALLSSSRGSLTTTGSSPNEPMYDFVQSYDVTCRTFMSVVVLASMFNTYYLLAYSFNYCKAANELYS